MAELPPKTSQFLGIKYPEDGCDPYYKHFEEMILQHMEPIAFFQKMFQNVILGGGGTVVWDGGTGLLTWTADFTLLVPHWGFKTSIVFGPDNTTRAMNLQDAQVAWIRHPMSMNGNVTKNFLSGSQLDKTRHDELVLAARIGSKLWMRSMRELA